MRLPDYTATGEGKVTVFLLHGSGHYPWAENASEFNRTFFGFLDRHFRVR